MLNNDPKSVLKKYGSSFFWASQFLGKKLSNQIARLYKFCRYVDNLADSNHPDRELMLREIKHHLTKHDGDKPIVLKEFLELVTECTIPIVAAEELMLGMLSDQGVVEIIDESELLRYCHSVAGTVGIMSNEILQCKNDESTYYAIDLGIAMQLTNIARDVLEDAETGRRYIPSTWLAMKPSDIAKKNEEDLSEVADAITKLVALADSYYKSALLGIHHIPWRSRIAIAIALRLYRQIGIQLVRNGTKWWHGRTIVSNKNKLMLSIFSLSDIILKNVPPHNTNLHKNLSGLAGVKKL